MFADAFRSELYKFWRNRTAWFWGFCFPPIVALLIGLGGAYLLMRYKGSAASSIDLGQVTLKAAIDAASPFTYLFVLMAAAVLFGGEYRWETWRLLAPRNSRLNLMLSKYLVFAAGSLFTIVAIILVGVLTNAIGAGLVHASLTWASASTGDFLPGLLEQILLSWVQLLQAGAVVALAAVLTRSILGAVMIPLVLGVAQAIFAGIPTAGPPSPWKLLALPNLSAQILRNFLASGGADSGLIPPNLAAEAAISTFAWVVLVLVVALAFFQRQDLAKE